MFTKKRYIFLLLIMYVLLGSFLIYVYVNSGEHIPLQLKNQFLSSLIIMLFLIIGNLFPKYVYILIMKKIFSLDVLKNINIFSSLCISFIPVFLSMLLKYITNYSFTDLFNNPEKHFSIQIALLQIVNPIELLSVFLLSFCIVRMIRGSIRDFIYFFVGYQIYITILNIVFGIMI